MAIELGRNQYGKAETRVVRIYRDAERHEIRDLNVTTTLRGDFTDAHTRGDQARVLPTDTQKNTCFAYAKEKGVGEIEEYALNLARHFVDDVGPVAEARVEVDEYGWERVAVAGEGHPHTFARTSGQVRTTAVTVAGTQPEQRAWIVSGLKDLVLLKSTGSEFAGFLTDEYTTLAETSDRILATSLIARWLYRSPARPALPTRPALPVRLTGWDEAYAQIRQIMLERFATVHSLALQQTLWEMGRAVLEARTDVAEIRLSAPNRHHFLADLAPFGLDNPGEVFYAADRPYGLIQCAVQRDDAADPGPAWDSATAFA
ncbi:MAG TPA: urate oxidase [Streptosporangiaceae bacterium]|jgi:urate oxidase